MNENNTTLPKKIKIQKFSKNWGIEGAWYVH